MFKKSASLLIALAVACGSFAGHAAAATELEASIDGLLGIKYKYGGNTVRGFDCSGFTRFVFAKFGIDLPRTSRDQAKSGVKVAKDGLRPGDLVFFNTNGKSISHVGIYMGDGTFAHASTSLGTTITKMSDSYYSKRYVTARRILDDEAYRTIAAEVASLETDIGASAQLEIFVVPAPESAISEAAAVAAAEDAPALEASAPEASVTEAETSVSSLQNPS